MELTDEVVGPFMRAGADALDFNAPMSAHRAHAIIDATVAPGARSVVDLGCGRGTLLRMLSSRHPTVRAVGVDSEPGVIAAASALAASEGLSDRLSYELGDAADWRGDVDAAICIGASHAFGEPSSMFSHLASLVPSGSAIVGDGIWEASPDPWCIETFGELPSGLGTLVDRAVDAGWVVDDADVSTLAEWDGFETGWTTGVRAVGTPEALAFAEQRTADYDRYRGVLGFGWLYLCQRRDGC